MNHVTQNTALELRDAGFPQPEFEIAQFWYVYFPNQNAWHLCPAEKAFKYFGEMRKTSDLTDMVYAPTATELLPNGWYLCRDGSEFGAMNSPCSHYGKRIYNDNPAEAAAAAWLYENK